MTREQKRMQWSGIALVIIGTTFAAAAIPAVYGVLKIFFTMAHWPFNPARPALDPTGRLMIAIAGGLTAGFGAMVWAVAREVMPVAPQAGRKVILFAAAAWFVVDSGFSVVAGSPANAVLNLLFLAALVAPLDLRRKPAGLEETPANGSA